ncbi:Polyamine deacetylase HDAC10, partial [Taenia solium]
SFQGKMWLSPACYGHMTHQLRTLAGGKLVVVLEGGYFIDSLERGCIHVLKSLLGDPIPSLQAQDPPSKRPLVKVVKWPEQNPTLSKSVVTFSQKVLRKFPTLLEKPTHGDIVFLLPIDKQNDLDRLFSKWTDSLKAHGVGSYQLQAYVEVGVRTPSRGDSDVSTPRKKTRLNSSVKSSLESAPTLLKALEDAVIGLFKNEFTVALVAAKSVPLTTFISVFSQVPFDLLKKFIQTKLEIPRRLSDQCSSKQPRPNLSFSNASESSESDSRFMYVDLTGDGELDSQAFECLDQKQGKGDSSKKISVLAFSFHYSGSDFTLTSPNSQSSWVNVPLQCCRPPKAPICTHSVANMLAIMDFVILPMSYAFAPNLLVINVGGSTTKEGAGISAVSRMHVVYLLKNVASRLVVLTAPDIDPDPSFLHCLLHDAPPKPFEQGQSSCANLVRYIDVNAVKAFYGSGGNMLITGAHARFRVAGIMAQSGGGGGD